MPFYLFSSLCNANPSIKISKSFYFLLKCLDIFLLMSKNQTSFFPINMLHPSQVAQRVGPSVTVYIPAIRQQRPFNLELCSANQNNLTGNIGKRLCHCLAFIGKWFVFRWNAKEDTSSQLTNIGPTILCS